MTIGCLYPVLIPSKISGIRVNPLKDTAKKDHRVEANILPMISLVLIIKALAKKSIVNQEVIPKTNTRALEVVLTEATLKTETPIILDMTNITAQVIDPTILDQVLRIDTINQSLLPIIRMALILDPTVDLPDPELLAEATVQELPVDQIIIKIRADLQATIRKKEIEVHPTMETQIIQLRYWKLNSLTSKIKNAIHCYVQRNAKTRYVRSAMDNIKPTIVLITSHMPKKTASTVRI